MNNELQSHCKSDKIKWICTLVGFMLVAVMFVGMCMQFWAKDEYKPSNWGKQEQQQENKGDEANGDIIVSGEDNAGSPLKLKLTRITMPLAGTATPVESSHMSYKLTAELTPANSTDKLDLALSGTDASKITLDHEDGAWEATVTVTAAFSNTVTLTGTVRNRDVSSSIKLDYLAKLNQINNDDDLFAEGFFGKTSFTIQQGDFGTGSVYPCGLEGTVTFKLDSRIYNKIKGIEGFSDFSQSKTYTENAFSELSLTSSSNVKSSNYGVEIEDLFGKSLSAEQKNTLYSTLYNYFMETEGDDNNEFGIGGITFEGTYFAMVNGVRTNCGTFSMFRGFSCQGFKDLAVPATNVDLGDNILFY